jgi:replicative DNA helicase
MAENERIPPQNLIAEQSVLGSLLIDKEAIPKVLDIIRPESFYREAHRTIYEAILKLFEKNEPIDLITTTEELRLKGKLEAVGGSVYVADLINSVPSSANVEYYARIVEEKAILRDLINAGNEILLKSFDGQEEVSDVLNTAEQLIFNIAQKRIRHGFIRIKDVLKETLDRIDKLYAKREGITGLPTGFYDLDFMTTGLQNSDLIIIAARPSVGKTALGLNIVQHLSVTNKIPTAVFSLEMSRDQLAQRLICADGEIESQRLRSGNLRDEEWKRLSKSLNRLAEAPIFIDDTAAISAVEIRAKARRLKIEHDIGLILIDYLQLMQGKRLENRNQEISDIARSLKTLSRELNIPVIALSQLSRAVESRPDRIPRLSDLRESGEIEQTADVVLFIHREDPYSLDTDESRRNMASIIIAKQRNGPTGEVELVFLKEYTRFANKTDSVE